MYEKKAIEVGKNTRISCLAIIKNGNDILSIEHNGNILLEGKKIGVIPQKHINDIRRIFSVDVEVVDNPKGEFARLTGMCHSIRIDDTLVENDK